MIKRIVFALALVMLPTAAMAQHHDHGAKQEATNVHAEFIKQLIALKADLKLTDQQIKQIEAFSVKMEAMHKNAADHHAKPDAAKTAEKMHADLLSIFTDEQQQKISALIKAHMGKHKDKHDKSEHKH